MIAATAMIASLAGVFLCAAAQNKDRPVFACNLNAIGADARPRYNELVKRIRAATRGRREISNGYAFALDGETVTLPEAAEWISMERLCCPFLSFQLSACGSGAHWELSLTGPEGVKPFLDVEFPAG